MRASLLLLAVVAAAVQLGACASPAWYAQAVHGHFSLMSDREEVQSLLASADTDPELARDLRLAVEVRDFAIARLDLPDNASYTSLVRTGREAVTWNVVAAPEFSLQPKLWCFVVSGCVPYRGYFKREAAERFAGKLADRGLDVTVAPAIAYSTLGWFEDPLVDTMFQAGATGLAATIFHELAHQKLYVAGDAAFSEAYASFVETAGVRAWLEASGRQDELREWRRMERARRQFNELLLETRQRLQSLYASGLTETAMREQKQALFEKLRGSYQLLVAQEWNDRSYFSSWFRRGLSNASLALLQNYQGGVCAFERLYAETGHDMRRFHALAADKADLDTAARKRWLVYCIAINGTFRGPQMIQDKAQFAVNGCSINKNCNAVLNHLWASLRARREALICSVAPLGKDQPFPARRALQLSASRHAESAINCDAVH